MPDKPDPIDDLLRRLHAEARDYDSPRCGLPVHDDGAMCDMRAIVENYRDAVIAQEGVRLALNWTKLIPAPGLYEMYTPEGGIQSARLVMGGFDGKTPFYFTQGVPEPQPVPESAEWATGPKEAPLGPEWLKLLKAGQNVVLAAKKPQLSLSDAVEVLAETVSATLARRGGEKPCVFCGNPRPAGVFSTPAGDWHCPCRKGG